MAKLIAKHFRRIRGGRTRSRYQITYDARSQRDRDGTANRQRIVRAYFTSRLSTKRPSSNAVKVPIAAAAVAVRVVSLRACARSRPESLQDPPSFYGCHVDSLVPQHRGGVAFDRAPRG